MRWRGHIKWAAPSSRRRSLPVTPSTAQPPPATSTHSSSATTRCSGNPVSARASAAARLPLMSPSTLRRPPAPSTRSTRRAAARSGTSTKAVPPFLRQWKRRDIDNLLQAPSANGLTVVALHTGHPQGPLPGHPQGPLPGHPQGVALLYDDASPPGRLV